jgi:hypothetical protein
MSPPEDTMRTWITKALALGFALSIGGGVIVNASLSSGCRAPQATREPPPAPPAHALPRDAATTVTTPAPSATPDAPEAEPSVSARTLASPASDEHPGGGKKAPFMGGTKSGIMVQPADVTPKANAPVQQAKPR